MTDAELKAIQAQADAATPGPWLVTDGGRHEHAVARDTGAEYVHVLFERATWDESREVDTSDAEFIAHARADVPALVAEVRLLRQVISDQQQESGLYDAGFRAGWRAAMETAARVAVHYDDEGPPDGMGVNDFLATYGPGGLPKIFRRMANDGDLRPQPKSE